MAARKSCTYFDQACDPADAGRSAGEPTGPQRQATRHRKIVEKGSAGSLDRHRSAPALSRTARDGRKQTWLRWQHLFQRQPGGCVGISRPQAARRTPKFTSLSTSTILACDVKLIWKSAASASACSDWAG